MAFYWEVYINVCKILINKLRITFILDLLKLLSCQIASLFQGIHYSWFSWFCRHLGNVGLIFSWCFGKFWKSLWFLFIFSPTTEKSHITFKSLDTFILVYASKRLIFLVLSYILVVSHYDLKKNLKFSMNFFVFLRDGE